MNTDCHPRFLGLSTMAVLLISALLYVWVGKEETSNWPANAVHNWSQFGFGTLHGKLVTNPGGFEVLTRPDIYRGHRPASFYGVFAVSQLLGWVGDGILMFHLIFSGVMFLSIWHLLGRNRLAAVAGAAAVLCPGYSIYPTVVDPNAVALYLMVPFAAVVIPILSARSISPLRLALLAIFTFAFTSLNWTTALGHGVLFCALLVMPAVTWPRLAMYVGFAGLSVGVVGGLSVLDKTAPGPGAAGGGNFLAFLAGYTWGHVGYGSDLTTIKAVVRLSVVNAIGLLPLLALSAWLIVKLRPADRRATVLALSPLIAAILGVLTLRNYFGHHPWMAAPMLLPGLVLWLMLLPEPDVIGGTVGKRVPAGWMFLGGSFIYALVVLGAYRAYHAEPLALASFVRHSTLRTDTLVVVESIDPQMAAQASTVSEVCDRRFVVIPDLSAPPPTGENVFLLSTMDLAGQFPVVARSQKSTLLSLPLIHELSAWYAQKVARRGAQDRHFDFTAGATFGLFRLQPPAPR